MVDADKSVAEFACLFAYAAATPNSVRIPVYYIYMQSGGNSFEAAINRIR